MSDPEKTARTPDPSPGYRGIFVILAAIAGLLVGAALLSASLINASVAEAGSRPGLISDGWLILFGFHMIIRFSEK